MPTRRTRRSGTPERIRSGPLASRKVEDGLLARLSRTQELRCRWAGVRPLVEVEVTEEQLDNVVDVGLVQPVDRNHGICLHHYHASSLSLTYPARPVGPCWKWSYCVAVSDFTGAACGRCSCSARLHSRIECRFGPRRNADRGLHRTPERRLRRKPALSAPIRRRQGGTTLRRARTNHAPGCWAPVWRGDSRAHHPWPGRIVDQPQLPGRRFACAYHRLGFRAHRPVWLRGTPQP